MLSVYKYPVKIDGCYFTLDLPRGAKVLSVAEQHGSVQLWALVNTDRDAPTDRRMFRFAGTGHQISDEIESLAHVSTFFMEGGSLVFHVFEVLGTGQAIERMLGSFGRR